MVHRPVRAISSTANTYADCHGLETQLKNIVQEEFHVILKVLLPSSPRRVRVAICGRLRMEIHNARGPDWRLGGWSVEGDGSRVVRLCVHALPFFVNVRIWIGTEHPCCRYTLSLRSATRRMIAKIDTYVVTCLRDRARAPAQDKLFVTRAVFIGYLLDVKSRHHSCAIKKISLSATFLTKIEITDKR